MTYQIESRSDLTQGPLLSVRIPEEELDKKALYTMQAELPDFVVPFRCRSIDGYVELTFLPGTRTALRYLGYTRVPEEYVALWSAILEPLLSCSDWFMEPYSFLLDTDRLYYDKSSGTVSYLYIPSLRPCSDHDTLKGMAAELSKQNPVTDAALENRVLRAIMQDFSPKDFLAMLKEYAMKDTGKSVPREAPPSPPPPLSKAPPPAGPAYQPRQAGDDDIKIDLSGTGKPGKGAKEKGLFGGKKKKEEKKIKSGGLFGKKKKDEIVLGAAAEPPAHEKVMPPPPVWDRMEEQEDGVTMLDEGAGGVTRLRLIGDPELPAEIRVSIGPGQGFTIGRFDIKVGRKQSDFEFPPKTKAVSRHHAAIERTNTGYTIVDLASSGGTFINGQALAPNVPCRLPPGARVSLGGKGADYIWEE